MSGFTVFREVDVAVPMDTTLTALTRFPRVLITMSPETFLWGVSRDQLHDVVTCCGRATSANGHAVQGAVR